MTMTIYWNKGKYRDYRGKHRGTAKSASRVKEQQTHIPLKKKETKKSIIILLQLLFFREKTHFAEE